MIMITSNYSHVIYSSSDSKQAAVIIE
jgi:hypothetical protein